MDTKEKQRRTKENPESEPDRCVTRILFLQPCSSPHLRFSSMILACLSFVSFVFNAF
jgi:hypothetical protein